MRQVYFAVFMVSCSALIFEVSLTRLFSIYLSYHFAFMVISIAMLGLGTAGTVRFIYPVRKVENSNAINPRLENTSYINLYSVLAGVSIISCYIASNQIPFDPVKLSWDRMQIFYVALYCIVLSIPFFFTGLLIVTAFSIYSERSGPIYSSDLVGAGTGSLAVAGLLNIAGPEYAVLSAAALCFIASFVTGGKKARITSVLLLSINIFLFAVHPDFINVRLSPYKSLSLALKYPGAEHLKTYYNSFSRIDTLKSPAVRFAPGLSLKYLDSLPEQIGISIDGGEITAVTKAANKSDLMFLEFLPSAIVYELVILSNKANPCHSEFIPIKSEQVQDDNCRIAGKKAGNVLVLDPKGGLQALMAEHYGAKTIHKVESNPLIVNIIQNDFKEFSGKIYENNTFAVPGRSWLRSSHFTAQDPPAGYDIIDIAMTSASVGSAFGISEDYRFTVEAFHEYLNALKTDGIISINLYLAPPPRTELRILGTVITALEEKGIKNPAEHIAAIRSWDSIAILIKNSAFSNEEVSRIKTFAESRKFDVVHSPGVREEETNRYIKMPSNEYFNFFKNILNRETRAVFTSNYLFDIKPVYDNNPFFHYYLRFDKIKAIYEVMGHKWQYFIEEGYILPVIFVQVLILSFALILLPIFFSTSKDNNKTALIQNPPIPPLAKGGKGGFLLPALLCFSMLGIGFMFVEITIIQNSILALHNPAYAVATVLTAVLVSSGTGSLLSARFAGLRTAYVLPVLAGLIFVYSLLFPLMMNYISAYGLKFKILIAFISLMPLGFFMGIPFPMGINALGQKNQSLIPWAWAINACLSVLAPVMAIMIAMITELRTVLWLSMLAYMLAFISLRKLIKG